MSSEPSSSAVYSSATLMDGGYLVVPDTNTLGKLDTRGTEVVDVLRNDGALDIQIQFSAPPRCSNEKRPRKVCKGSVLLSALIIIYGPMALADDIGRFFQECELYLQDPVGCDRNVPYYNPHRLTASSKLQMTFDVCFNDTRGSIREYHESDFLDTLITAVDLPGLETPQSLRTKLLP